ncbi:hypothetical protein V6N11_012125 [Hibiscus sabdariffa]|uniref:Uncharacterized protein n=1 Tax=Hibiscus sabdariffa TaxID=183260 RepID=A0ABR2QA50_9ROSI
MTRSKETMPQKLTVVTCLCKYDNDVNVILMETSGDSTCHGAVHGVKGGDGIHWNNVEYVCFFIPSLLGDSEQETSMAYCPECTLLAFNFGFKFDSEALLSRKSVLLMSVAYYRR